MIKKSNDKDIRFLIILLALFVAVATIGLFCGAKNTPEIEPSDLPESADTSQYDGLVISEIVSSNNGVYINNENEACDFVELYNASDKDIELEGYGLSDASNKIKWAFPKSAIKAKSYLIVNLSGKAIDGLNANFKLSSSGGESVALFNASGKVIDAVETVALAKNQAMIRDGREFKIAAFSTPGFENSQTGRAEYLASIKSSAEPSLVINELLPKNAGNFKNADGKFSGYIEIKNISDRAVDLSSCFISNDDNAPFKFKLGQGKLRAGEILYFYTGDVLGGSENYLGFGFENKIGKVILCEGGKISQVLSYENVPNGCAYIRDDSGSYYINSALSMGFDNTTKGIESFVRKHYSEPKDLVINELMTSNNSVLPQNGGHYYDWIELYNNSGNPIKLSDYAISLSDNLLTAAALPNKVIAPGEYFVIMCSGDSALSNSDYVHCNLKLGTSESIYLFKSSEIADSVYVYNVPQEYSFGRTDKGWCYCETPTPLSENSDGSIAIASTPIIKKDGGIYDGVDKLQISIEGQGTIYYTTDGSNPSTSSRVYDGPIYLSESRSLKACSYEHGQLMSDYACASYIINDPHEYPVVSLTLEQNDFDNLVRHWNNRELVYPAYIELFEENSSYKGLCGVTLQGNTGRRYNRKNFAIKFDGEFGSTNMNYALFEQVNSSSYDSFVIRGGSNASMYVPWKDEFATEIGKDYLEIRNYKPFIYYVNGRYMGLYYIREKITPEMIANHYNVSKENVNMVRWNGDLEAGENVWEEISQWVKNNDMTLKENYAYFCSRVDVQQLCDLWILQAYFDNPDVYNIRIFSHPDIDNGQMKFIFFDLDLGLYNLRGNYFSEMAFNKDGAMYDLAYNRYSTLVNLRLLENNEFRDLFLTRLGMFLSGPLSSENVLALYDSFADSWKDELVRDRQASNEPLSDYTSKVALCRRNLARREDLLKKYAKEYFELTAAELKKYFD